MDLRHWISAEHDIVQQRLDHGVLGHVPPARWRELADGGGASVTWLLFHATYHEDLAVRTAIRKQPPLLATWREHLGLDEHAPVIGVGEAEERSVTEALDPDTLLAYRRAVVAHTRAWLGDLSLLALDTVPNTSWRLEEVAGIPRGDAPWLHDSWGAKTCGWFVMWECIGHPQGHIGELTGLRNRMGLSPH